VPADSEAPVRFQFSVKGFSGVWILQNVSQRFSHFPVHLRIQMPDKVRNGLEDFESNLPLRICTPRFTEDWMLEMARKTSISNVFLHLTQQV
jgi:hypothetical protein